MLEIPEFKSKTWWHDSFLFQNKDLSRFDHEKNECLQNWHILKHRLRKLSTGSPVTVPVPFCLIQGRWKPKIDNSPEFMVIFCKKWQNLPDYFYLRCSDIMDRSIQDGLVSEETLAYLLTFVPQSFMAISWIIIDIGENMCRGGWCTRYTSPP